MTLLRKLALGLVGALACVSVAQAQTPDTLRVATDATFMPFEFQKDGKLTGFDIDMIGALGKKLGAEAKPMNMEFKGLIPALQGGRIDLINYEGAPAVVEVELIAPYLFLDRVPDGLGRLQHAIAALIAAL